MDDPLLCIYPFRLRIWSAILNFNMKIKIKILKFKHSPRLHKERIKTLWVIVKEKHSGILCG